MSDPLPCPFCGATYPNCGEDCYNYKIAELVMFTFERGGRHVSNDELIAAWNRRTDQRVASSDNATKE